ncbi:hypothetical protein Daura_05430 [Dactylosporangium aurantiacum]|uniref:Uncharacterized protein n=1 Tax=Dactylosporangium aurantiacum TaxID=35754 RepID=A0A9Q9IHA0_9ACTN|nr:hypothetical protein [Dactylosporangium aurantiacum]MDG6104791.1 hypothetical protein [Dactylosporangium aurantiacum]UWZ55651.1 hypothetical protein Daura_05430 [Dactylosporangium aurantiacum]
MRSISGLSKSEWDRAGALADAADDPGNSTAVRGFEWSHPLLGHVNVWFTNGFTDLGGSGNMGGLYNWIVNNGGVARFNHPGREIARFGNFAFTAAARAAVVGLEMFNRGDDYLFDGWSEGRTSALNACLNAGWRTGISGVPDEHGTDWGFPEGKGRTGLWVADVIDTVANQVVRFTVPLDAALGDWVVLRVSDPTLPDPSPGPNGHPCNDFGLAYTSPWWLRP